MSKGKGTAQINKDRCKGCGLCTINCPVEILIIDSKAVNAKGYRPATVTDDSVCTGCGNCALMCPDSTITVKRFSSSKKRGRHG